MINNKKTNGVNNMQTKKIQHPNTMENLKKYVEKSKRRHAARKQADELNVPYQPYWNTPDIENAITNFLNK